MNAESSVDPRRRVLVVEADPGLRQTVADMLWAQGLAVDTVGDGQAAIAAIDRSAPHLVILDLDIPLVSGFEVLARIRASHDVGVILLSERAEEIDRVLGLELGADDYVGKPVPLRELAARVRAVLRRLGPARRSARLRFGQMVIDPRSRQVLVGDREVGLRPREFDLLLFLASSPGQVFTRGQILEHVWGSSPSWQDPDTVTEHVRRIRRKTEADPARPERIVTVRGVGYRFEP